MDTPDHALTRKKLIFAGIVIVVYGVACILYWKIDKGPTSKIIKMPIEHCLNIWIFQWKSIGFECFSLNLAA